MTTEEVAYTLDDLRAAEERGDREAAASGLAMLLVDVLREIAEGTPDPQALAAAALVGVDEELGDE
jgi:hypothetical protein